MKHNKTEFSVIITFLIPFFLFNISLFAQPQNPSYFNGLVLEIDASKPGYSTDMFWRPYRGNFDGGRLLNVTDPASGIDNTPELNYEVHPSDNARLVPFYRFRATNGTTDHHGGGGMVTNLGDDVYFDYDQDFTIEAWIRVPQQSIEPDHGRGFIFSTQSFANGYRLNVRSSTDPSKFYFESRMRDNSQSVRKLYHLSSEQIAFSHNWLHVVLTYDGTTGGDPVQRIYVDGIEFPSTTFCGGDCDNFTENNFLTGDPAAAIGGRDSFHTIDDYNSPAAYYGGSDDTRYWFSGDIAAVRVWDHIISQDTLLNNYQWSMPSVARHNDGDINFDRKVDSNDLQAFMRNWLEAAEPLADFDYNETVDLADFAVLAENLYLLDIVYPDLPILFNNDTTNILSCISPYHQPGQNFNSSMVRATVDETANTGIDAHFLSPGLGRVPFWQSKHLPMEEHYDWYYDTYGVTSTNQFLNYIYYGGDIVQVFVEQCRANNLSPFISHRLNDTHHLQYIYADPPPAHRCDVLCKFYYDNPQYRLGPDLNNGYDRIHNWVFPGPREYIFRFLEELCQYDIDGLELDFKRWDKYFNQDETTSEQRRSIMNDYVSRVRKMIDQSSSLNEHRLLCVRIPNRVYDMDRLGINMPEFAEAGVDIFNMTNSYYTVQQNDVGLARQLVPNSKIYSEVHYVIGYVPQGLNGDFLHRRTTPQQFYTAAHLAYANGADGISAFNFVYYRKHSSEPWDNEPPFEVFETLRDPEAVAVKPQHYVIADTPQGPPSQLRVTGIDYNETVTLNMQMVPPSGGWSSEGKMRIMSSQNLENADFDAKINGISLTATSDVSEPYEHPFLAGMGEPAQYKAWTVPFSYLVNGNNIIQITCKSPGGFDIYYLDLAIQ